MESIGICCSEHILAELESSERKFFCPLAVHSLVLLRKVCTTTNETLVVILKKNHLILLKTELVSLLIHSLHSLEKRCVQRYVHRIFGKHRRHLLGNLLHFVTCVSLHKVEEDTCNLIQCLACISHSLDCVFECRLVRIGNDSVDLSLSLFDSGLESRKIMFCLDLVKLRCTERCL